MNRNSKNWLFCEKLQNHEFVYFLAYPQHQQHHKHLIMYMQVERNRGKIMGDREREHENGIEVKGWNVSHLC
jgi:hypothetical protein